MPFLIQPELAVAADSKSDLLGGELELRRHRLSQPKDDYYDVCGQTTSTAVGRLFLLLLPGFGSALLIVCLRSRNIFIADCCQCAMSKPSGAFIKVEFYITRPERRKRLIQRVAEVV